VLLRPAWSATVADPALSEPEQPADLVCQPGAGPPVWLCSEGLRVFVSPGASEPGRGHAIASFEFPDGSVASAVLDDDQRQVRLPFSLREAYQAYISESWRTTSANRRLSERTLKAFYLIKPLIPRKAQLLARRRMIRAQGVPEFPSWPLDLSVGRLLRFYAACSLSALGRTDGEFLWFWPENHSAAVILTHDVENNDGIQRSLELADVEEAHGFRSSFNFGSWYTKPDMGVVRELTSRGFEVGMHGLTHDRQLFSSREAFEERLEPLAALATSLGAVGFRSPATHRVFDWLAELPVEYDATISNSDPYEPQPGGCCSVWPFFVGDVVELPYTLPQDHTLLTLLGHRSPALWLEQARIIEENHGLIQCVTHPDPGYLADADKRAVYAAFLEGLSERTQLWRPLPREAAAWWRTRAVTAATADVPRGRVTLDPLTLDVTIEPPA
jgi:peptidoglycan/xylan/chitin deacetylase (PgdA/CDA1 family)